VRVGDVYYYSPAPNGTAGWHLIKEISRRVVSTFFEYSSWDKELSIQSSFVPSSATVYYRGLRPTRGAAHNLIRTLFFAKKIYIDSK